MTDVDSPLRSLTSNWPGRTLVSNLAVAAAVPLVLAGCSAVDAPITVATPGSSSSSAPSTASTEADTTGGIRVLLRMPDGTATVSLTNTPAARQLVASLPIDVVLSDPMGQAKSGRLRIPLDVNDADRVSDPQLAGLYYWSPSGDIGIVYDDLGQTVPPPGLVQLGSVVDGLDTVAHAGNRFTVSIERV